MQILQDQVDAPDIKKYAPQIKVNSGGPIAEGFAHGGNSPGLIHRSKAWRANSGGPFAEWLKDILKAYTSGDFGRAYQRIGYVTHLIEDQSSPPHGANVKHDQSDRFEHFAEVTSAASAAGIETVSGVTTLSQVWSYYRAAFLETKGRLSAYKDPGYGHQFWIIGHPAYLGEPCAVASDFDDPSFDPDTTQTPGCTYGKYGGQVGIPGGPTIRDTFHPSKNTVLIPAQMNSAVRFSAGMLFEISKKLPPLIQGAALTPTTWNGAGPITLAFRALENRRPSVTLKAVVLDDSGETEMGEAAIPDPGITLVAGTALPYEGDVTRSWDGKYLGGSNVPDGRYRLRLVLKDEDQNEHSVVTGVFVIDRDVPTALVQKFGESSLLAHINGTATTPDCLQLLGKDAGSKVCRLELSGPAGFTPKSVTLAEGQDTVYLRPLCGLPQGSYMGRAWDCLEREGSYAFTVQPAPYVLTLRTETQGVVKTDDEVISKSLMPVSRLRLKVTGPGVQNERERLECIDPDGFDHCSHFMRLEVAGQTIYGEWQGYDLVWQALLGPPAQSVDFTLTNERNISGANDIRVSAAMVQPDGTTLAALVILNQSSIFMKETVTTGRATFPEEPRGRVDSADGRFGCSGPCQGLAATAETLDAQAAKQELASPLPAAYKLSGSYVAFTTPAQVSFRLKAGPDVRLPADPTTLAIHESIGSVWAPISNQSVATEPDGTVVVQGETAHTGLFSVLYARPDTRPPRTAITFGEPRYDGADRTFVTADTQIVLEPVDDAWDVEDGMGVGPDRTYRSVDGGPSQVYVGPFFMTTEGLRTLRYHSVDLRGNVEFEKTSLVEMDVTAPEPPSLLADGENPSPWSNAGLYALSITPSADRSGVLMALGAACAPPTSNDDGAPMGLEEGESIFSPPCLNEGANPAYVWLMDNLGNADYHAAGSIDLRYDSVPPRSLASSSRYVSVSPITVSFVSTDEGADQPSPTASGVAWTKLWYRRVVRDADCNTAQGPWTETALPPVVGGEGVASSPGTFSFDPQGFEGNYCFYTQVADVASNTTPPPVSTTVVAAQTLYDPSAPAISGLRLVAVGSRSGTLEWTTDDPTGGLVEYGPTTAFGSSVQTAMGRFHSAVMDGALPSPARIYYRVTATNQAGLSVQSAVDSFVTSMDLDYPVDDFGVLDMTQPIQIEISNRELNSLSVSLGNGQTVGTSLIVPAGVELVKITMNGITINALFQPDRLVQAGENPYVVSGGGVMSSVSPGSSIVAWTAGEAVVGDLAAEKGKAALGYYARIDPVKPGDIAGFTAAPGPEQGQLTLAWTAVGDDSDKGTAMSYDLRISPEPLTQVNFLKAARVRESPHPSASGSPQSVILAGLDPATRYYFGIKAVDELENASASAALADAATLAPEAPPLPPPDPIEIVTLPPGGVEPPPPVTMEIDIPVTGPFTGWQNLTLSLNGYIQQTQFVVDDAARNVRLGRLVVTGGSIMTGSVPGVSMAEMAVGQAVVASPAPIGGLLASGLSGMDLGYYAAIDPVHPGKAAGFTAERGENPGEVVLSWNAPGDDAEAPGDGLGVAKAMTYELRHAEAELAVFDFNTATPAQAPLPADVGTLRIPAKAERRFGLSRSRVRACRSRSERSDAGLFVS